MFGIARQDTTKKPVIAMCHLRPLPGDPHFNESAGITDIIKKAHCDIDTLQHENIHGILFSNEFSYPYSKKLPQLSVACMARIIGELKHRITVPFGVDCMYDGISTIDLALATDADFCRITLSPASVTEYELGLTEMGNILRHEMHARINQTKLVLNIDASARLAIQNGTINKLFRLVTAQAKPDAICVSAETINTAIQNKLHLNTVTHNRLPLFCDGGCTAKNINSIINDINGVIVGTTLKGNRDITMPISPQNTREFLSAFSLAEQQSNER